MNKTLNHTEQTQYLYDTTLWLYDYVFAFFYGFVLNDNYGYDAKSPNSGNMLSIASYTYDAIRQRSAQAFGNLNYEYYYFSNVNRLILQNTYGYIFMARRGVSLRHTASEQELSYVWNASSSDIRYKFTGKERDAETGFDYFGARYYSSDISVWLRVDPLAEKNFGVSPYNYCHWNPIMMIDPDGRNDGWVENDGEVFWDPNVNTQGEASKKYGNDAVHHKEYITNENNNNYFLAEDGSVWTASNSTPSERVFSAENGTNVGGELSGVTVIADNSHQYNSSVLGLSLTLSAADGPFPFGEIIGGSILAVYTGYYIGQYIVDKIGNEHYPDQVYTIPDPTGNIPFNNPPRGPGNHNIPKGAWWFMVAEGAYETYNNYKEKLDLVPKPQVAPRDKTYYKQRIYPTP
jgi:RHS repeat-associated protein